MTDREAAKERLVGAIANEFVAAKRPEAWTAEVWGLRRADAGVRARKALASLLESPDDLLEAMGMERVGWQVTDPDERLLTPDPRTGVVASEWMGEHDETYPDRPVFVRVPPHDEDR